LFVVGKGALSGEFPTELHLKFTIFTRSASDVIEFLGISCERDRSLMQVSAGTSQLQCLHPEGDGGMESGRVQTKRRAEMMTKSPDENVLIEQATYLN